jgi:hypothetical protein
LKGLKMQRLLYFLWSNSCFFVKQVRKVTGGLGILFWLFASFYFWFIAKNWHKVWYYFASNKSKSLNVRKIITSFHQYSVSAFVYSRRYSLTFVAN